MRKPKIILLTILLALCILGFIYRENLAIIIRESPKNGWGSIVILLILAFLGLFVIPRYFLRRAITKVIQTFRKHEAINAKSAKTIDELGLRPRTFMETLLKGRDYKPYALDLLRRASILQMTKDGRVFLSEEKLSLSGLEKR